jgi:hypothetical protein
MVDTGVLKTLGFGRTGSTPVPGTKILGVANRFATPKELRKHAERLELLP